MVDNIIFLDSTSCIAPENNISIVSFPSLIFKKRYIVNDLLFRTNKPITFPLKYTFIVFTL